MNILMIYAYILRPISDNVDTQSLSNHTLYITVTS